MLLNPQLSGAQPYNFGVAETYSYIPVSNDQGRPLYAKATYDINTGYGQNGFDFITSANGAVYGSYTLIQVVSSCTITGLTASNTSAGSLSAFTLPANFVFSGPITGIRLGTGAVIAYK
jgi:hypothetical protein